MSLRPAALLVALSLAVACSGGSSEVPVELGTYVLDREASAAASLPLWDAEMQARYENEKKKLSPNTPRSWLLKLQRELEDTRAANPGIVEDIFARSEFTARIDTRRRFTLEYKVPELKESGCSGRWQWLDGELQFLRSEVDGEALDQEELLRAGYNAAVQTIRIDWPGLENMVFLLTRQDG